MYGTLSISLPCCVAYHPLSPPQPSLAGIVDYYDTKETLYLVLELFVAPLNFLEGGILIDKSGLLSTQHAGRRSL